MLDLLTDDGQPWALDDQRLEEITLLTEVMIGATACSGPLTQVKIDALLAITPTCRHPRPTRPARRTAPPAH